jgi:hypothetical protein
LTFYDTSCIFGIDNIGRLVMFGGLGKLLKPFTSALGGIASVAGPLASFIPGVGQIASPFASIFANVMADGKIDGNDIGNAAKSLIPGGGILDLFKGRLS